MVIAGTLLAALALACTPALAAGKSSAHTSKRSYFNGAYAGTVNQSIPQAYRGAIGFTVHAGVLSGLHFTVTMVCGKLLLAQVQSPPTSLHVRVSRAGDFAYTGSVAGAQVDLEGRIRGGHASGTFFESFHTSAVNVCTMYSPAPFGAGL